MTENLLSLWFADDFTKKLAATRFSLNMVNKRLTHACHTNDIELIHRLVREAISYCEEFAIDGSNDEMPKQNWEAMIQYIEKTLLTLSVKNASYCSTVLKNNYTALASRFHHQSSPLVATTGWHLLLKVEGVEQLLTTISNLWHQSHQNDPEFQQPFLSYSANQLNVVTELFHEKSSVALFHAVFLYHLHPEFLFQGTIHPERLISQKQRLREMYQFIEVLHEQLYVRRQQLGMTEVQDYLFHGDELPRGVRIVVDKPIQDLIQLAIKSWHPKKKVAHRDEWVKEKLVDINLAYKFWFNPSRLIDTVMTLNQWLVSHPKTDMTFRQKVASLYARLSTSECMDLYGNFANKDTRYLMKTMKAILTGTPFHWLPPLTNTRLQGLAQVYQALSDVMSGLRDALSERFIVTKPFVQPENNLAIKPGQRNRQAIVRSLELYEPQTSMHNKTVDELFGLLEE